VGEWEKFQKQKEKKKLGAGREENKVPKKKTEIRGKKKLGRGQGEKIKLQKKIDQG